MDDFFGMLDDVRRMDKRQFFYQVLSFGMIVSSALMIWKGLMVATGSESPIVVVLSGSMEPAFHRGDLLFLTNKETEDIRVGEIVVFKVNYFFSQMKLCQNSLFTFRSRAETYLLFIGLSSFMRKKTELLNSWPRETTIQLMTEAFMHPANIGWRKKTLLAEPEDSYPMLV